LLDQAGAARGAHGLVAGFPAVDRPAPTNFIKLHVIGETGS
jgi:hypothetical protein